MLNEIIKDRRDKQGVDEDSLWAAVTQTEKKRYGFSDSPAKVLHGVWKQPEKKKKPCCSLADHSLFEMLNIISDIKQ